MEQLNTKQDSWLSWSLFVCLVLALSMSLTACGNKKSSGKVGSTPAADDSATPNCSNCPSNTEEIDHALRMMGAYADPTRSFKMSFYVAAPKTGSNGSVYVSGHLKVDQLIYASFPSSMTCLPAGDYTLSSEQLVGSYIENYSTSTLMNVTLVAKDTAGKKFNVRLDNVEIKKHPGADRKGFADKYYYTNSFWGNISFGGCPSVFYGVE